MVGNDEHYKVMEVDIFTFHTGFFGGGGCYVAIYHPYKVKNRHFMRKTANLMSVRMTSKHYYHLRRKQKQIAPNQSFH